MTRQRLHDLAALHRRRGRDAHGVFLVEGVRSVEAAVAAGAPLVEIVVAEDAAGQPRVADVAARAGVRVSVVPSHEVERISDAQASQGIVAVSRRVVTQDVHALAAMRAVVLLDGVQDPGNVGALVRSAAWFGVDAVVVDAQCADPEGPKAVRASMGGLWDVALVRVPDLGAALAVLAASGAALWGADMGGMDAADWVPPARTALVFGSEAHGLSPAVAERLNARVSIARGGPPPGRPPSGRVPGVESLNVVVAAGILLHRWRG